MSQNEYLPFLSEIKEVIAHTEIEYTFRMAFQGQVRPGQFFEVSLPKYGEAPISVSGVGENTVDLTIRRVGKVTNEIFTQYQGQHLFLRGPYGNGFQMEDYTSNEIIIVAGGTGLSPVRGVVDYFATHPKENRTVTLIVGFKSPDDILFREDLARWEKNINVIFTVDNAPAESPYQTGLVTAYIPTLALGDVSQAMAIVVGPPVMMRFATQALLHLGIPEEHLWISQERKMCCGIGKCGHCKIGNQYVCLDGPVFNYTLGKTLID